jgi:hypothetical protein
MMKSKSKFLDAFPPDGLVAQYKPFILKETRKYSQRYKLPLRHLIHEAVSIANGVAEKFDPHRGYDFSTPLRWHLRSLNRHAQKHYQAVRGRKREPTSRVERAMMYRGMWPIVWQDHVHMLRSLFAEPLRPIEIAILNWMIDPRGLTLTQIAANNGISKGYASKLRYRLLLKSYGEK